MLPLPPADHHRVLAALSWALAVALVVVGGVGAATTGAAGGLEKSSRVPRAGLRIDINSAGAIELALLPGIGPALAERIVADRAAHGPYRTLDDLDRVPGIGAATVARLREAGMVVGIADRAPERAREGQAAGS